MFRLTIFVTALVWGASALATVRFARPEAAQSFVGQYLYQAKMRFTIPSCAKALSRNKKKEGSAQRSTRRSGEPSFPDLYASVAELERLVSPSYSYEPGGIVPTAGIRRSLSTIEARLNEGTWLEALFRSYHHSSGPDSVRVAAARSQFLQSFELLGLNLFADSAVNPLFFLARDRDTGVFVIVSVAEDSKSILRSSFDCWEFRESGFDRGPIRVHDEGLLSFAEIGANWSALGQVLAEIFGVRLEPEGATQAVGRATESRTGSARSSGETAAQRRRREEEEHRQAELRLRQQQEREEQSRRENERLRVERERLERERQEQERVRLENERIERERLAREREAKEREEQERRESPALFDLRRMPGMEQVAENLGQIQQYLRISRERERQGLPVTIPTLHVRFEGNPGVGKTTAARAYGQILRELGFLRLRGDADARSSSGGSSSASGPGPDGTMDLFDNVYREVVRQWRGELPNLPRRIVRAVFLLMRDFAYKHVATLRTQPDSDPIVHTFLTRAPFDGATDYPEFERMARDRGLLSQGRMADSESMSARTLNLVVGMLATEYSDQIGSNSNRGRDSSRRSQDDGSSGALTESGEQQMPIIEVSGADFTGTDAVKKMREAIASAQGGVLIIDELYGMDPRTNSYAREASAVLLKEMEDRRDQFVVIPTGYSKEMEEFMSTNPGFQRRFAQRILFEDYSDEVLASILQGLASKAGFVISEETTHGVVKSVARQRGGAGFGNAGTIRNVFEAAIRRQADRIARSVPREMTREILTTLTLEDFDVRPPSVEDSAALKTLNQMIGLEEVKRSIESIISLLTLEQDRIREGLNAERPLLNAIFSGNPGVGKTTIGKIYARILKDLGYLSDGEFLEVKASDLVGNVIGESEQKTKDLLRRGRGKFIFIDEAYLLFRSEGGGSSTYGRAVLDTLVGGIQADSNQDMVVTLAGYPAEMNEMLAANPGLARRFPRVFHFADYTAEELGQILLKKAVEKDLVLTEGAVREAMRELSLLRMGRDFGNAGEVENLLGRASLRQASRLSQTTGRRTRAALQEIREEDIRGERPSMEDLVAEVEGLRGLEKVKESFEEIQVVLEELAEEGMDPSQSDLHVFSFEGYSAPDHERVAGLLARVLNAGGVLPSAELVSVQPSDLIGEYLGQSTAKTRRTLERAFGKTLLIRSVGGLSSPQNTLVREAVEQILTTLNSGRGQLTVVFADHPQNLARFFSSFPEIERLIEQTMQFEDFSLEESVTTARSEFDRQGRTLTRAAQQRLQELIRSQLSEPGFGNERAITEIVRKVIAKQKVRVRRTNARNANQVLPADFDSFFQRDAGRGPAIAERTLVQDLSQHPARILDPRTRNAESSSSRGRSETRRASRSAEVDHRHDHDHDHHHRHEEGSASLQDVMSLSQQTRDIFGALDRLGSLSPELQEQIKESVREGELQESIVRELAEALNISPTTRNLAKLKRDFKNSVQEMKAEIERIKELAETDEQVRNLVEHYICLACGRSDCDFMPFTWFEEV